MRIAANLSIHRRRTLRHAIHIGLVGVAAFALSACHDDDPWEDFEPFDVPNSIAVADFNADGRLDLTVAYTHVTGGDPNQGYNSIILQNAAPAALGTFARGIDSGIGFNPSTLAAANIDNVGGADVAVANAYSGTVSVLLQSGTTGQIGAINTLQNGGIPFDVALGLLNNDTFNDVVVADVSRSTVNVFYQESGTPGTFAAPVTLAVGNLSTAVAIGDVDADGLNDVVVANQDPGGNAGRVSIFFGSDNTATPPTFDPRVDLAVGTEPIAIKIADIDADGAPDLVVANEGPGSAGIGSSGVTVLRQDSNALRTFFAPIRYATARSTTAIAIDDFNADGLLDIAAANRGGSPRGTVSVLLQSSSTPGVYVAAVNYPAIFEPLGIATGDLNGDGDPDIAIADGKRAAVLFNTSPATAVFTAATRVGE